MQIMVRIFLDENMVRSSDLAKLIITNPTVDRIVNDIVDRQDFGSENEFGTSSASKVHSA
jgi:hypothetical protein